MKTLRFIGMSLVAIVLCVNFTACSDDDETKQPGQPGNDGLKLSTITWHEDGGKYIWWTEYSYDSQGRIVRAEDYDETGQKDGEVFYEYNENGIVITDNGGWGTVCTLNSDGLIERSISTYTYSGGRQRYNTSYVYDANKRLISCETTYTSTVGVVATDHYTEEHFTWENGNLTQVSGGNRTTTYRYTDIPSSKGFVFYGDVMIDIFSDGNLESLANLGYFGKLPQNLLSGGTENNSTWEISYEFGEDGYISKISIEDDWATLTWK